MTVRASQTNGKNFTNLLDTLTQPGKRAGLIPVWVVVDQSLLLESRLKSGPSEQQLSGGRGDLQVKLPILTGSLLP